MSRPPRSNLPGTPFHITSRTIGRNPWFNDSVRDFILRAIDRVVQRCDVTLIAFAIMRNHLHLIIRQGAAPLASFMQPLLTCIALHVQRETGWQGHVFERRYFDRACTDPYYLRDAIVYTHLNPVRAGICDDPAAYPWSSHVAYSGELTVRRPALISSLSPLPQLFAGSRGFDRDAVDIHSDYLEYVRLRRALDRQEEETEQLPAQQLRRPTPTEGDRYWAQHFGVVARSSKNSSTERPHRPDLRDLVQHVLSKTEPKLPVELLFALRGGSRVVRVRREIIERAVRAGHRKVDIARFLKVSETTVSRVVSAAMHR